MPDLTPVQRDLAALVRAWPPLVMLPSMDYPRAKADIHVALATLAARHDAARHSAARSDGTAAVEAGADNILTIIHSSQMKPVQQTVFKNMFEVLQQTLELFLTDVGENDMYVPRLFNDGLVYIDKVKNKMRSEGVSDALIDNYFNVDESSPYQNRKPIRMHLIQPLQLLGGGPGGLVFDPVEMKSMLAAGETSFITYAAHFTSDNFWA